MKFGIFAAAAAFAISSTAAQAVTTVEDLSYEPDSGDPLKLFRLENDSDGSSLVGLEFAEPGEINDLFNGSFFEGDLSIDRTGDSDDGHILFKFQAKEAGLIATNFSTDSPVMPFTGLEIAWISEGGSILSSISGDVDDMALVTTFTTIDEVQFLRAKWTGYTLGARDIDLDFNVASVVPVPAGILLLGTAFAGAGFMSRRSKRQAA